jgi:hypothetical protein
MGLQGVKDYTLLGNRLTDSAEVFVLCAGQPVLIPVRG